MDPFSDTVGQWWTWFRILVVCVALGGALYAWAKPALTGILDNDEAMRPQYKPENVGQVKRMLTMVSIAAGVWWLTSDGGISFVETVFHAGAASSVAESPFEETEFTVADDWFTPTSTTVGDGT